MRRVYGPCSIALHPYGACGRIPRSDYSSTAVDTATLRDTLWDASHGEWISLIAWVVTTVVMHWRGLRAAPWSEWCVASGPLLAAQEESQ